MIYHITIIGKYTDYLFIVDKFTYELQAKTIEIMKIHSELIIDALRKKIL